MQELARWKFEGDLYHAEDISALAMLGDEPFLAIAGDEGALVQILERKSESTYALCGKIDLHAFLNKNDNEIDIEGLAFSRGKLYVLGSHSMKRKKVDADKSQQENLARLREHEPEPDRQGLYEVEYLGDGKFSEQVKTCDLLPRLKDDPILGPFLKIPSKENGLDLEGVAADGDHLLVGCRGPVLRQRLVPVLKFDFDKPDKADLLLVELGGRGIRDLVKANDGYLLIGGPMRDEPLAPQLYHWNGQDATPGTDCPAANRPRLLGAIPLPHSGAKAEGLEIVTETEAYYDVLVVYDSSERGSPTLFRVAKSA